MFNSNEEIQIIGIDLGDNLDMKNQYIINEEMTKLNEKLTLKSRYDNAIKKIERLNNENKQYKEYIKELKDSLRNYHIKNNKLTNENGRLNNIINKLEKELKELTNKSPLVNIATAPLEADIIALTMDTDLIGGFIND